MPAGPRQGTAAGAHAACGVPGAFPGVHRTCKNSFGEQHISTVITILGASGDTNPRQSDSAGGHIASLRFMFHSGPHVCLPYSNNTRDPDRRRRRCFHANFTTPGLTKWCRRKQGVSCTRCCSYFSAILRCGYNRRDPPPADPSQHGARDGKQKLQQSKSNIPPHVQNPATSKRPYAHPA